MGRSVLDILSLNPNNKDDLEIIKTEYTPVDIHKVKIGANTYTNYGAYWFFWEKTFVRAPQRSGNGSMGNINDISTFLTGHLVIDFSIISIDDYRSIMRSHYEQNEFVVECYDPIYNNKARLKMYFATEERKKLYTISRVFHDGEKWNDWLLLAGVQDYQLEMIGTNNDLDTVTVTYNLNAPADTGVTTATIGSTTVAKGGDFICGSGVTINVVEETFNGRYKFKCWNTNKAGGEKGNYVDGEVTDLNDNMVLYAIWGSTETRTLTFSYGEFKYNTADNTYSALVKKGIAIGELPTFEATPSVTYNERTYYPYSNGGWYKTSTKASNSTPITKDTLYWANTDDQVFLLYNVAKYNITYSIDGEKYQDESIEYNGAVPLPKPFRTGYTFSGWFASSDLKTPAPTLMPPVAITLYGKWVKS